MKKPLKRFKTPHLKKRSKQEAVPSGAVPRITNQTVAEHREEVLSSARKYIYPLQHSKHKIVIFTVSIVLVSVVAFFTYCTLALYRYQGTSNFLYKATQVIPFPIARQGNTFIAYENYLFEVRRIIHYYQNNQQVDFSSDFGRDQLVAQKQQVLADVVNQAYIKQIAKEKNITVSDTEVEDTITLLRNQGKLGNTDDVLNDVLQKFYGWSRDDFERSLRNELLERKVFATLDTDATGRAESVLAQLQAGGDFGAIAKEASDDITTRDNGGEYGFVIEKNNKDLDLQTLATVFKLQPGQISGIVTTATGLEIYKMIELTDGKAKVAHITFNFKDVNQYLDDLKEQRPTRLYIKLPEPVTADPSAPAN